MEKRSDSEWRGARPFPAWSGRAVSIWHTARRPHRIDGQRGYDAHARARPEVARRGGAQGQVREVPLPVRLQDRFHLLELPREEMPALYQTADVLLHMSIDEPSANAYIEAMATGLPVVTHDRPVTRWTFQDVAYLVDTTNSEQVTAALRQAIGENEPKLVNERRQRAVDVFAWDSIALKYADFIRDTV